MGRTVSGTISHLEVAWTSVAGVGLLFSTWLTLAGWWDFAAVRAAIKAKPPRARAWGPRWWVGLSALVANGALCLIWLGFILIGWIAMQFPPPPPTAEQQVSNWWAGWVLIVMETLLAGVQVWHVFVRRQIDQIVRRMS